MSVATPILHGSTAGLGVSTQTRRRSCGYISTEGSVPKGAWSTIPLRPRSGLHHDAHDPQLPGDPISPAETETKDISPTTAVAAAGAQVPRDHQGRRPSTTLCLMTDSRPRFRGKHAECAYRPVAIPDRTWRTSYPHPGIRRFILGATRQMDTARKEEMVTILVKRGLFAWAALGWGIRRLKDLDQQFRGGQRK